MGSYSVRVQPDAKKELRSLPGHVRQRVWRALQALEQEPRPANSAGLDSARVGLELDSGDGPLSRAASILSRRKRRTLLPL